MKSLLLIFLLCMGACLESYALELSPLASVVLNSTTLHQCNAFFYEPEHLFTTASCVSCATCKYKVMINRGSILDDVVYDVSEIRIHPRYNEDPAQYNAAILVLKEQPPNVVIYSLPNWTDKIPSNGTFFKWSFDEDTGYSLIKTHVTYVHRNIYHIATGRYLQDHQLAILGDEIIPSGPYDEGSPFITKSKNGEPMVFGYLTNPRTQPGQKFFPLTSIPYLMRSTLESFFKGK